MLPVYRLNPLRVKNKRGDCPQFPAPQATAIRGCPLFVPFLRGLQEEIKCVFSLIDIW
jgi:hypothetical protein